MRAGEPKRHLGGKQMVRIDQEAQGSVGKGTTQSRAPNHANPAPALTDDGIEPSKCAWVSH